MRILIVDDDSHYTEIIRRELKRRFPESKVELIDTEHEFRDRFEDIATSPPDVIILDVLIKWAKPSRTIPAAPIDVSTNGVFRAGIRCQTLLASDTRTARVPIIIHSILSNNALALNDPPPNVFCVPKTEQIYPLIRALLVAAGTVHVNGDLSLPRRVFLSHSHNDKRFVRYLARRLQERGIEVWIDEAEIEIGQSLIDSLRTAINDVDFVVAIISKHSIQSGWVTRELDIAMNLEIGIKKIKVLPVLLDDSSLPGFLEGKLYADFRKGSNRVKAIDKLCKAISY